MCKVKRKEKSDKQIDNKQNEQNIEKIVLLVKILIQLNNALIIPILGFRSWVGMGEEHTYKKQDQ